MEGTSQETFAFSLQSLPHFILAVSLLAGGLIVAFTRGDGLIRASLLGLIVVAMPYAVVQAVVGSCNDPGLAESLGRLWVGTVSLVGPALMLVLLAVTGRFERYRTVVVIAVLLAMASCVFTWTTELVIDGVWKTRWGFWYPHAGPVNELHIGQVVLWSGVGFVLSRSGFRRSTVRQRSNARWLAATLLFASLGVSDGLMAHGLGVYPFGVVPACVGTGIVIVATLKYDLLHRRGFDWATAYEVGLIALFAGACFVALVLISESAGISDPVMMAMLLVPVFAAAQLGIAVIHNRIRGGEQEVTGEAGNALEEFVDNTSQVREVDTLAAQLEGLLATGIGLSRIRLLAAGEGGVYWIAGEESQTADSHAVLIDARVRVWMMANPAPLVVENLPTMRLGGLRDPIEDFMAAIDADVVVPLVDREQLVGMIATALPAGGRALRESEVEILKEVAGATARAMTYVGLFTEAEARVEVAKEVEVAAAVGHARSAGEKRIRLGDCEIISYYQPAAQFGGHWWTSHELVDGRILVVIGDVSGHGVSAALVSFTVEGACETAQRMFGANLEVLSLLQLLNDSVADVGGTTYVMSCFAAVFDPNNDKVTFANAGHPFPYVCRRREGENGRGRAKLRSLVSRGTPLGADELILSVASMTLEPDDVVVFYSQSLVDSQDPKGVSYGDRRFQRVLRNQVRAAGEGANAAIVDDAFAHYQNRPIDDDINLLVVRLGVG